MNHNMMPLERFDEIAGHERLTKLFRKMVNHYGLAHAKQEEGRGIYVSPITDRPLLVSSWDAAQSVNGVTSTLRVLVERGDRGSYVAYGRVTTAHETFHTKASWEVTAPTSEQAVVMLAEKWQRSHITFTVGNTIKDA